MIYTSICAACWREHHGSFIAASWQPPQLLSILAATFALLQKMWKIVKILSLICIINSVNGTSVFATHTQSMRMCGPTAPFPHIICTHTQTYTHSSSVSIIECISSSHWGMLMLLYGHFWSEWVWIRLECMCADENYWDGALQWSWKSLMAMVMFSGLSCSLGLHRLTAAHSHWTLCLADKLNSQ